MNTLYWFLYVSRVLIFFLIIIYVYVCLTVCVCTHACMYHQTPEEGTRAPWSVELQMVVSHSA